MTSKKTAHLQLSIVIPAYNEQDRIGRSLERVREYCRVEFPRHEVLVVDDGSQDATAERVQTLSSDWPELRLLPLGSNRGKGFATKTGVLAARGDFILCSDADLSTPIDQVLTLLEQAAECPVVIGSRSIPGASILRKQPFYRVVLGRGFNWLAQMAAAGEYADTQCGFKLYRRKEAIEIFSRLTIEGFAFDVEVLYLAKKLGLPICQVPVTWINDPRSTVNPVSDPVRMFFDLLRFRWRQR